jgi:hypothetical protein
VFRVDVDSLTEYFNFDPTRKVDLQKLDKLMKASAPGLKRYFHRGTPEGEPGMRFKMIGYGKYEHLARSGKRVEWPAIGIALQKNYISVYLSLMKDGVSLVGSYAGRLGELRLGHNNFSFRRYADLNAQVASTLFAEADHLFNSDPGRANALDLCRYLQDLGWKHGRTNTRPACAASPDQLGNCAFLRAEGACPIFCTSEIVSVAQLLTGPVFLYQA